MKEKTNGQVRRKKSTARSLTRVFALDLLLVGVGLLIFALFHHVIPRTVDMSDAIVVDRYAVSAAQPEQIPIEALPQPDLSGDFSDLPVAQFDTPSELQPVSEMPSVEAGASAADASEAAPSEASAAEASDIATEAPTVEPVATATAAPVPVGYFGNKYPEMFTRGEVYNDGRVYRNENVNITMSVGEYDGATYYIADIYIRDISNFVTGLAKDKFGKNISEKPSAIAERIGSIVAINGDYYSVHDSGVVIRNGTVFRTEVDTSMDICVLYYDGTMETFSPSHFDAEAAIARGAYQAWSFGPRLLVDGQAQEFFNTTVAPANPRAAIGYYEPGHYCFIVVDGRNEQTEGLTIRQMSLLMESLGCKVAFNLDGGNTAQMVCGTAVVNNPSGDRNCSDIVAIVG